MGTQGIKEIFMTQTVFIMQSGKANISCPECGKVRQMDLSKYLAIERAVTLKATCSCGQVFPFTLERRLHVRKTVDLEGRLTYRNKQYPVKVLDISRLGMKIRTLKALNIREGDRLVIDFILDDVNKSRISREITVRKVNRTDIGVMFPSPDHYDRLGPYLLFKLG